MFRTNGLGSVRAITDAQALVVRTYRIDEFGVPLEQAGVSTQRLQYTGEQRDLETGFVYLRTQF